MTAGGGVTDAFAGKLAGLLAHKDHDVRRAAAGLLNRAEMNLPRAAVSLAEAVTSDNGHLVREAAEALKRMGPAARDGAAVLERALPAAVASQRAARAGLAFALLSTNGLWATQSATALGRLGADAAAAVPGLLKLLDDERIETRRAVAGILSKLGPHAGAALPALLKGVEHPDRRYAADCLAAIKAIGLKPNEGTVRLLDGIARRGGPELAALAVEALAAMGTNAPAVVESLRQAVGHRERAVREAAFAGLCAMNRPPVSELARMLSGGEDAQRRTWAAEKVAVLGPAAGALKAIGSGDAEAARRLLAAAEHVPEDEVTP